MRRYRLGKLGSLDALQLKIAEGPVAGPGQVVVRMRAFSLNHRDLTIVYGKYTSVAIKPGAIRQLKPASRWTSNAHKAGTHVAAAPPVVTS